MSTIEKVKFRCLCGTRITASIELAGKTGRCPNCKATVIIPDPKAKTLAGDVKIFDLVEKTVEDIGSDDLSDEVLGSKTPPSGPGTSGVHVVNIPKSSAGRYAFIGILLRWKKKPVPYTIAFVILSAIVVLVILAVLGTLSSQPDNAPPPETAESDMPPESIEEPAEDVREREIEKLLAHSVPIDPAFCATADTTEYLRITLDPSDAGAKAILGKIARRLDEKRLSADEGDSFVGVFEIIEKTPEWSSNAADIAPLNIIRVLEEGGGPVIGVTYARYPVLFGKMFDEFLEKPPAGVTVSEFAGVSIFRNETENHVLAHFDNIFLMAGTNGSDTVRAVINGIKNDIPGMGMKGRGSLPSISEIVEETDINSGYHLVALSTATDFVEHWFKPLLEESRKPFMRDRGPNGNNFLSGVDGLAVALHFEDDFSATGLICLSLPRASAAKLPLIFNANRGDEVMGFIAAVALLRLFGHGPDFEKVSAIKRSIEILDVETGTKPISNAILPFSTPNIYKLAQASGLLAQFGLAETEPDKDSLPESND